MTFKEGVLIKIQLPGALPKPAESPFLDVGPKNLSTKRPGDWKPLARLLRAPWNRTSQASQPWLPLCFFLGSHSLAIKTGLTSRT